jgi:hypothetical protein
MSGDKRREGGSDLRAASKTLMVAGGCFCGTRAWAPQRAHSVPPRPSTAFLTGTVTVQGGSVRGGTWAALFVLQGAKAVAEGAVLEAAPAVGQAAPAAAAWARDPRSTLALRRCELLAPAPAASPLHPPTGGQRNNSLVLMGGARATVADCICGLRAYVMGEGSSLLHTGLAFPPGLEDPIQAFEGSVVRELPGPAGPAGRASGAAAPPAAPHEAGSHGAGPGSGPAPPGGSSSSQGGAA